MTSHTSTPGVALVSMPFAPPDIPSIQLGIIKALLDADGIRTADYCLYMDFLLTLRQRGYHHIYNSRLPGLLSEWFFSRIPFDPEDYINNHKATNRIRESASATGLRFEDFLAIRNEIAPAFIQQSAKSIPWEQFDAVCFTLSYAQLNASFCLAEGIKKDHPEISTIFGGAYSQIHDQSIPAYMEAYPFIDYFVLGEAEPVIVPLARHILNNGDNRHLNELSLPGIFYRHHGRLQTTGGVSRTPDMSASPVPDYTSFFTRRKELPTSERIFFRRDVPIELSRGCPWGQKSPCTFCAFYPCRDYRPKNTPQILNEIKSQVESHRARSFYVVDAGVTGRMIGEVFPEIIKLPRKISIPFIETRTTLTEAHIRQMKQSGVTLIQPGIECLDTGLLRKVNKGVSLFNNLLYMKWARKHGIRLSYNIILGLPDATLPELQNQLQVMKKIPHLDPPYPVFLSLVRFSGYFNNWGEYYNERPQPDPFYHYIHPGAIDPRRVAFEHNAEPLEDQAPLADIHRGTLEHIRRWQASWGGYSTPPYLTCSHRKGTITI